MTRKRITPSGHSGSDVAVLAVGLIGGSVRFVHTEDVAMKAAELAPRQFSWKRYPEQVNLEAVRLALKGELPKAHARISGGIRIGWMLTPQGVAFCRTTLDNVDASRVTGPLERVAELAKRAEAIQIVRENQLSRPTQAQIRDLLRVDEYSTPRARAERCSALLNAAGIDRDLEHWLMALEEMGISLKES